MMAVPELRFPEFDREWEDTPMRSLMSERNDQAPQSDEYPLMAFIANKGVAPKGDRYNRDFLVKDEQGKKYKKTEIGDFIYSSNNLEAGSIGMNSFGPASISPVYSIFKINKKCDHKFISEFLSRPQFIAKMVRFRQGVVYGQWRIHEKAFLGISAPVPTLPEQQKIAAFLGAVDDKIDALRRKHDGLKQFKAGLMQKLFSQELRFKRDDGSDFPDWEEKRLGEVLQVKYGKDHKDLPDGPIPVYGTGGVMRHVDRAIHSGPSILIGRKGTIDQPRFATEPFWTVDTLFYSDIYAGYVPYFAFLVVQSVNWLRYNEATGVPSLSATAIHGVKVHVPPDQDEQQKIADCLSAIDAKIEAVDGQITQMEAFKKGLLQKMFV